jgi:hypothetical protein
MLSRSFVDVLCVCPVIIGAVVGEISATDLNLRLFKSSLGFDTSEAADKNDATPVEAIQVIGAGFGRTGTQSLKAALQQLGYKVNHFEETFSRPDVYLPGWEAVLAGEGAGTYLRILAEQGFNATLDSANALLYKEMMAAYPEAKVLLSVRSDGAEGWATSSLETVWHFKKIWTSPPFIFKESFRTTSRLINWIWEGCAFGLDRKHDEITREDLVAGYDAWVADVVRTVPPQRLLVFRMQDGWTPLCTFLEVIEACPTGNFPHVNDKHTLMWLIRVLQTINWIWPVFPLLFVYLCLYTLRACTASFMMAKSKKD